MNRLFLILLVLITSRIDLNAQTEKGKYLLGGSDILELVNLSSLAGYREYDSKKQNIELSISPIVGYFIIDDLSIGVIPSYNFQRENNNSTHLSNRDISISAFSRYYLGNKKLKPFIHLGIGYINQHKQNEFDFDDRSPYIWNGNAIMYEAGIGLGYFITDYLSLDLFTLFSYSKTNMLFKGDSNFDPRMDHVLKSKDLAINLSLIFYFGRSEIIESD